MEPSISETTGSLTLLGWGAVSCAGAAAAILLWFLIRRPRIGRATKTLLLLGIGVLPIGAAFSGNLAGYQRTMERDFCGSCHTMRPYTDDSGDPTSTSLASMHARNASFGGHNCYVCHQDYGMFGTVTTKVAGMRHVWEYYTEYRSISVEDALPVLQLYKPYPNASCMQCHSTALAGWNEVDEHAAAAELIRSGELSCAGEGCHGPAHPFSKEARKAARRQP